MPEAPKITIEDLRKQQQLMQEMTAIRESLRPKYEQIAEELKGLKTKGDILFLMEFEGKSSFTTKVEWEGQTIEVKFKIAKVG